MENNKLSIVITFYNKKDILINAVNSIIHQIAKGDEIIILDDASNDEQSLIHLEEVKTRFNGIKFIHNIINQGASEAKNIAISSASNEIIVLLDADDTLPINALQHIRNAFNENQNIDLLFGNYNRIEISENIANSINCKYITTNELNIDPKVLVRKWLLLGTSPFKKQLHTKLFGFDKLYPRTDDRDFHIKAILSNANLCYIDKTIYNWHRYSDGNNSNIPGLDSTSSYFRNIMFYYKYSSKLRFFLVLIKNMMRITTYKFANQNND